LSFDFISQRVGLVKENGVITSAYLTLRTFSNIDSAYLTYLFKAYDTCKAFHGMGKGLRQTLSYKELRTYLVCYPPLAEQQAIADFLDKKCNEIDELVALQEKMIEELKAYKQSVITEAVCKGLNPNVPMKDSGVEWIGEIPKHWRIDKLVRTFDIIGSGTTPKDEGGHTFEGNINWIQSGDINGGILLECKNQISDETLQKYSALKVYKSPFIIVAMYGASVGNISISQIDGCVNQACCVLSRSTQSFDYMFYAIKSAKDFLIYMAEGGGQPNISQDKLRSLWIPIPTISEQQEIADYLDKKCSEIDQLIFIKQQKIVELKDYKKSLIYEYTTGKKEVL
jgi:type I restriction enzyme S subunit